MYLLLKFSSYIMFLLIKLRFVSPSCGTLLLGHYDFFFMCGPLSFGFHPFKNVRKCDRDSLNRDRRQTPFKLFVSFLHIFIYCFTYLIHSEYSFSAHYHIKYLQINRSCLLWSAILLLRKSRLTITWSFKNNRIYLRNTCICLWFHTAIFRTALIVLVNFMYIF